jgi:hypothetical protein
MITTTTRLTRGAVLCVMCASAAAFSVPARADNAGAFVGGMLAAQEQTARAAQEQAANSARPQPVPRVSAPPPPPAPAPAPMSPQQKLQELDKLAAGGYITPEEYKARRKAILDSI